MKLLEERIKKDGIVLPGNVLKVDSFLNHQIDPELSKAMGEEFARLFGDAGIDRVLTVEASGIAIGVMTALTLHVPLVFARKKKSALINEPIYTPGLLLHEEGVLRHPRVAEVPASRRERPDHR